MANRYTRNRNLWRKVYAYGRKKPRVQNFADVNTGVTHSYDLNRTLRHRDYFKIPNVVSISLAIGNPVALAEYDEGLIHFNRESSQTTTFNFTFTQEPIVVLTMEPTADNSDNVIPFETAIDSNSISIGLSAEHSGAVRYRAIYASSYPAHVTSSFTSSLITASAGRADIINQDFYTASFAAYTAPGAGSPSTAAQFLQTPYDRFDNFEADVALDNKTLGTGNATNEISTHISNSINFIAYF